MNQRTIRMLLAALLLTCPLALAEQSQRPLPGTFALDDAPIPSVCVEEGVSLRLEPTVYASVSDALQVQRIFDGQAEEMPLQTAIDRGLLVCRSREGGHLGLVFEKKQPGEYRLVVPPDAPAVVARS